MRFKFEDGPGPESQECLNRTYRNIGEGNLGIMILTFGGNNDSRLGLKLRMDQDQNPGTA